MIELSLDIFILEFVLIADYSLCFAAFGILIAALMSMDLLAALDDCLFFNIEGSITKLSSFCLFCLTSSKAFVKLVSGAILIDKF